MPIVNSDNKFGLNRFVVNPTAGSGAYTTIQSALDAANLAGGGTVEVMQGVYTENITLYPQVFVTAQFIPRNYNVILNESITCTGIQGDFGVQRFYINAPIPNAIVVTGNTKISNNLFLTNYLIDCVSNNALNAVVSKGYQYICDFNFVVSSIGGGISTVYDNTNTNPSVSANRFFGTTERW